jgi:RecB family endonuclease NucS
MIDPSSPFILQAKCTVTYDGRAYSVLNKGIYLIIHKSDGSIQIHGAKKIKPLNYQSAGSILTIKDQNLISINKKEKITIKIHDIIFYDSLELTDDQVKIQRTEKDLVNKIFMNWFEYFDDKFEIIETEHRTPYGIIDLLGITDTKAYIIEVKRRKIMQKDVGQLERYVRYFKDDFITTGYLAGPEIAKNALTYLKSRQLNFLCVDFD